MANELTYDHGIPITLVFTITNCAQSSTVDGVLAGVAATNGLKVPTGYAFHAIFIDAESNAARTAGSNTVKVIKDGTELSSGPEATLDGTNTTRDDGVAVVGDDPVAAGEEVGVSATGDGTWAPGTADFDVILTGILLPA